MSEEDKKTPKLRFEGFVDDWEQRKLGNMSEITDTKHATAPVVDFETQYRMIRTSAVRDGRLFPDRTDYVTYDTYEQWSERIHLKPNDVVISREAPMGEAAVIPTDNNKYFLGQRMVGIRIFDDLDPFFLLSTFLAPKFRKEIQIRNAESTTVANFGIPSIKGYEVDIPKKEEQTKIGSFFRQLDNTIALHQRKLTLLAQLKQAYHQVLFPQGEESIPALRFTGFSEPWEQRKLGDMVQITMGQSPNGENYTENSKDHILVQGNADMKNGRVSPRVWTTQVTREADPGDIILSVRAPVGDVGTTDYPVVLGRGVAGIKGNAFIFQTLSRMKELGFWTRYSSGSTFDSINSADLKDAFIPIPNIEEQTKIGDFFSKIDGTIAIQQSKLQKFEELKKVLLAKMLV